MVGRKSKSEHGEPTPTTTFKLSDKSRFALHVIARQSARNYTAVLEEAIEELARSKAWIGVNLATIFDVDPGVAMLSLFARHEYKPSPKEEDLLSLIRATPEWWYKDAAQTIPRRDFATILWPNRQKYVTLWLKRERNYWGAVEAMAADMKKARPDAKLPKWGDK